MIYLTRQLSARISDLGKSLLHSQLQFNLTEEETRLFQLITKSTNPHACLTKSLKQYDIGYRLHNNQLVIYSNKHKKTYKAILDIAILLEALPDNAQRSWIKKLKTV